ncbi:Phospholipase D gamma 2 [Hibiscus syriacus]|uniref:phospholipase D n=1 Tax=Hibiscus syriacus TaxID=106335 RepID=A0A6A2WGR9_HIBSY|nr:Phospholipase D gamma 2 [Hibiscus syriacus]
MLMDKYPPRRQYPFPYPYGYLPPYQQVPNAYPAVVPYLPQISQSPSFRYSHYPGSIPFQHPYPVPPKTTPRPVLNHQSAFNYSSAFPYPQSLSAHCLPPENDPQVSLPYIQPDQQAPEIKSESPYGQDNFTSHQSARSLGANTDCNRSAAPIYPPLDEDLSNATLSDSRSTSSATQPTPSVPLLLTVTPTPEQQSPVNGNVTAQTSNGYTHSYSRTSSWEREPYFSPRDSIQQPVLCQTSSFSGSKDKNLQIVPNMDMFQKTLGDMFVMIPANVILMSQLQLVMLLWGGLFDVVGSQLIGIVPIPVEQIYTGQGLRVPNQFCILMESTVSLELSCNYQFSTYRWKSCAYIIMESVQVLTIWGFLAHIFLLGRQERRLIYITGWSVWHKVRLVQDGGPASSCTLGDLLRSKSQEGANNLIPMEIALKIASKIAAHERFAAYIVVPMLPEVVPTGSATQRILFWHHKTMQMMYETIHRALVEAGLENAFAPQDFLNFFCHGNREINEFQSIVPYNTSAATPQVIHTMSLLPLFWYCNVIQHQNPCFCIKIFPVLPFQGRSRKNRRFMISVLSKGMIVDDEYIIIGSANINQRLMEGIRDTEIAMGAYQPQQTWAKKLSSPYGQIYGYRMSLWAEHLGVIEECFTQPESLECVRRVKHMPETNWKQFAADEVTEMRGHLLKYHVDVDRKGKVRPLAGCETSQMSEGHIVSSFLGI